MDWLVNVKISISHFLFWALNLKFNDIVKQSMHLFLSRKRKQLCYALLKCEFYTPPDLWWKYCLVFEPYSCFRSAPRVQTLAFLLRIAVREMMWRFNTSESIMRAMTFSTCFFLSPRDRLPRLPVQNSSFWSTVCVLLCFLFFVWISVLVI